MTATHDSPAAPPSAALGGPAAPLGSWTAYALSPARTALLPYLSPTDLAIVTAAARGGTLDATAHSLGIGLTEAKQRMQAVRQQAGIPRPTMPAVVAWACRAGLLDDLQLGPRREVTLTPERSAALALVAEGLLNEEIAVRLWLSRDGLKTRLRLAYSQIGAHTRAHAVALDWRYGYSAEPATQPVAKRRRR